MKYSNRMGLKVTSSVLFGMLVATGCVTSRADDKQSESGRTVAAASVTTTIVGGADTAYYFDDSKKLVAIEALDGLGRKITLSEEFANEDGLTFVMKSSCQQGLPAFDGRTEMVGKASTVVYAVAAPNVMMAILGVEDLSKVQSRIIEPLKGISDGGVCCCALRRCGPVYCCPCPTKTC